MEKDRTIKVVTFTPRLVYALAYFHNVVIVEVWICGDEKMKCLMMDLDKNIKSESKG